MKIGTSDTGRSPFQGSATQLLFLESTIVKQSAITYFASTKLL